MNRDQVYQALAGGPSREHWGRVVGHAASNLGNSAIVAFTIHGLERTKPVWLPFAKEGDVVSRVRAAVSSSAILSNEELDDLQYELVKGMDEYPVDAIVQVLDLYQRLLLFSQYIRLPVPAAHVRDPDPDGVELAEYAATLLINLQPSPETASRELEVQKQWLLTRLGG
ncbi:MAG: hypothetical protein AAFU79_34540 [Myxococcota bacterium]